ncbi:hypothetical protein Golob_013338 [Gossypium lobatum]|uniref:Uncharacterized protein n=1 Tax=Gossypium lobatum TaxID=34289 RepID=A0A7J8LP93_9ROSI|nr:hypothetical protein [Gossypium lobatum]
MMNSLEVDGGDDDSRPSEDHNTKKVRFKDGFDVVAMDMVVDTDPSPSMAILWKDKLLGVGSTGSIKEFIESDGEVVETISYLKCGDGVDQVTRLPGFMYKRKIIEVISGMIGKATKFDFKNDNRISGHFAKMAVFINLDRPLVSLVLVNGEIQRVEYEALSMIYFYSGNTKTMIDGEPREVKNETRRMFKTAYRLWMLVEQRSFEARVVYEVIGIGEEIMEGTTTQNEESDRITNETRAKDNINDFLGAQTRSGKDLDTSLEAQLSSGNDDAMHAGEGSKLGHGDVGPNDLNFGSVAAELSNKECAL